MEWISWLGNLIKLIGDLIPQREKIAPTHRGILFKGMKVPVVLTPGVYWYWPWRSELHQIVVSQQTLFLEEQDVTTADGITVKVRGTVTYQVRSDNESVIQAAVDTWEIQDQIDNEAMAVYCDFISENTFNEVAHSREKTDVALTERVQEGLEEYGVLVVRAKLTSFASGTSILHLGIS